MAATGRGCKWRFQRRGFPRTPGTLQRERRRSSRDPPLSENVLERGLEIAELKRLLQDFCARIGLGKAARTITG